MVDMLWANEDGLINGVRHSIEMKGAQLEGDINSGKVGDEMKSNAEDDDKFSTISDQDDEDYMSKKDASSIFRSTSGYASESRISISHFNQNCLIPAQILTAESLMAGVTYDPTSSENQYAVSLIMDGNDLAKIKNLLMITALLELFAEEEEDDGSQLSHSSRLLSPLARKTRAAAEQTLEASWKTLKETLLNQSREVTELSLKYCKLNEKGLFKLFASLRNNEALQTLDLCGNVFTSDNTSASLGNLLNFNKTLSTLSVQEANIGNVGATLLSQALHINTSITFLNLSANSIDAQGCVMLASALTENKSLTHLNISRNLIGSRGAQTLATALHHNRHLLHLDVGRQRLKGKLGQDGAKVLAHCLMLNNVLRVLRIGRNRLGFEGCRHLAGALLTNRTLQVLDLGCNKIGIEGSIQIANAVLQNSCVEYVIIGHRRLPVCHLIGHYHENRRQTECSFIFNFQDKKNKNENKDVNKIAQSIVEEELETAFEKELEFDYNIYCANDEAKVHSDSVFNASRSDFRCVDFQVLQPQYSAQGGDSEKKGGRIESYKRNNTSASGGNTTTDTVEEAVFSISDEEAVFIAHLIKDNSRLESLRIDHSFLPIQKLRGRPYEVEIENSGIIKDSDLYNLDLSNTQIKCPDAIVIGILIADNPRLQLISLQGNDFSKTEGETWISNALAKNPHLGIGIHY